MAFSLNDVTVIKGKRKGMIRKLFAIIKSDYRLTIPIRLAFEVYLEYLLKTKSSTYSLSIERLKQDINKVLTYNCNKPAVLITKTDTEGVETQIICDIKMGIKLGGIQYIKYNRTAEEEFRYMDNKIKEINKSDSGNQNQNKDIVVDKFGMVINREQVDKLLSKLEVF